MSGDRPSRFDRLADLWWTAAAPVYDRLVAIVGWHRAQDALVSDVTRGTVLEVGCGPAHLAGDLLARGVEYVGLDRNPAMVARASRTLRARPDARGVVVRGDATALPFRAESFDVVVASGVLGLLPVAARRLALREMARVSRGRVRLLEPIVRPDVRTRRVRTRVVALVRDRPIEVAELAAAGLDPRTCGPGVVAGVYSAVRATKRPAELQRAQETATS